MNNNKNKAYLLQTALCSAFATTLSPLSAEDIRDGDLDLYTTYVEKSGDTFVAETNTSVDATRETLRQKVFQEMFGIAPPAEGAELTADQQNQKEIVDILVAGITSHIQGIIHAEEHHAQNRATPAQAYAEIDTFLSETRTWVEANIATSPAIVKTILQEGVAQEPSLTNQATTEVPTQNDETYSTQFPSWKLPDIQQVTQGTPTAIRPDQDENDTSDFVFTPSGSTGGGGTNPPPQQPTTAPTINVLSANQVYGTDIPIIQEATAFAEQQATLTFTDSSGSVFPKAEYEVHYYNDGVDNRLTVSEDGTFTLPTGLFKIKLKHVDVGSYNLKLTVSDQTFSYTIKVTPKTISLPDLPTGSLIKTSAGTPDVNLPTNYFENLITSYADKDVALNASLTKDENYQSDPPGTKEKYGVTFTLTGSDKDNYTLVNNPQTLFYVTTASNGTPTTPPAPDAGLPNANLASPVLKYNASGTYATHITTPDLFIEGATDLPTSTDPYAATVSDGTTSVAAQLYSDGSKFYVKIPDGLTLTSTTDITVAMDAASGYQGSTQYTDDIAFTGLTAVGNDQIDGTLSGVTLTQALTGQSFNLSFNAEAATPTITNVTINADGTFSITGITPDMQAGNVTVETVIDGVTITGNLTHTVADIAAGLGATELELNTAVTAAYGNVFMRGTSTLPDGTYDVGLSTDDAPGTVVTRTMTVSDGGGNYVVPINGLTLTPATTRIDITMAEASYTGTASLATNVHLGRFYSPPEELGSNSDTEITGQLYGITLISDASTDFRIIEGGDLFDMVTATISSGSPTFILSGLKDMSPLDGLPVTVEANINGLIIQDAFQHLAGGSFGGGGGSFAITNHTWNDATKQLTLTIDDNSIAMVNISVQDTGGDINEFNGITVTAGTTAVIDLDSGGTGDPISPSTSEDVDVTITDSSNPTNTITATINLGS